MAKLLLVDDDVELVELLAELLTLEGFDVVIANNGRKALELIDDTYDLILLDVMMPELNGIETLKQIRQHFMTPIMMLTARGNEIDRIIGLELGADDYLPKPFNDRELVARIKAILRRSYHADSAEESRKTELSTMTFCGITLHAGQQQAYYKDKDLELTGTEYALLQILLENKGHVLSRDFLSMEILNKPLTPFDRSIDMHMSNLRKKLPVREDGNPWFKTLRRKGYLLITEK